MQFCRAMKLSAVTMTALVTMLGLVNGAVAAEKAVAASETGKTLTMTDYDGLVAGNSEDQQMDEVKRMIKLANIKSFFN